MKIQKNALLGGTCALCVCLSQAGKIQANVIMVNTAYTGTAGANGVQYSDGDGNYFAGAGGNGYVAATADTYIFTSSAVVLGGTGGAVSPAENPPYSGDSYYGGSGGFGVFISGAGPITFNGGSYTGGTGGAASGTASAISAGGGSNGLAVETSSGLVQFNGGTFTGGGPGTTSGAATSGDGGGVGASIYEASANVSGGTFTGAQGNNGLYAGPGATVNIEGGTFTGGSDSPSTQDAGLSMYQGVFTLYGSDFTVNGVPASGTVPLTQFAIETITGHLEDNAAPTTFTIENIGGGTLNLVATAVPEPVCLGMMGVAGGIGLLRRRRVV